MPLKKSQGQMYPWVDATHTHLGGECPHKCSYCYVDNPRFGRAPRYQGEIRLIEDEFKVKYDEKTLMKVCGKYPAVIFVENCNDLFAESVPLDFIFKIIRHCRDYPKNIYVFQTKNPIRFLSGFNFPQNVIFGTTIESNLWYPEIMKDAPHPVDRFNAMLKITGMKFLTIEPVLDFDVEAFARWIKEINPNFLNLGADSKGRGLPEPTFEKIMALTAKLKEYGIELREKHNLERLKQKQVGL